MLPEIFNDGQRRIRANDAGFETSLAEGGYFRDLLPQHQGVHAGGSLEGADGLKIAEMPHTMTIGQDTP